MIPLFSLVIDENTKPAELERIRRNHESAIAEMQRLPFAGARVIEGVELENGITKLVSHKLGRRPVIVLLSPVRGPSTSGRIEEIRDGAVDRTQYVQLRANGYGATVTVDVVVT